MFDPNLMNARLYLATAYASQYIPGAPSEENIAHGNRQSMNSRECWRRIRNLSAIDGIGSILFQMAGQPFDREEVPGVQDLSQRHIELKPDRSRAVLLDRCN